jgi:hypothetical protein
VEINLKILFFYLLVSYFYSFSVFGINEEEALALAISASKLTYEHEKRQREVGQHVYEDPPVHRDYSEELLTDKTFIKDGMGAFFFPEKQMTANASSELEKQIKDKTPGFHRALLTLENILADLDSSPDFANLQQNIGWFEREYNEFMSTKLYSQMTRQDMVIGDLNRRLKPILEHPVILLKDPPTSWQSIMYIVGILNGYRKKALDSSKLRKVQSKKSEELSSHVKSLDSYLQKIKVHDSNPSVYEAIEPAKTELINTLKSMSEKLKVWHPADYPDALGELHECFTQYGHIIQAAELSIDPELALAKSVLEGVVLYDLQRRFESENSDGENSIRDYHESYRNWLFETMEGVKMWPRERVIGLADLMLGQKDAIKLIALNFPRNNLPLSDSAKIRHAPLLDTSQNKNRLVGRRDNQVLVQSQGATPPDLSVIPVNVTDDGVMSIAGACMPKSCAMGLIRIKELNLPVILNLPEASWETSVDFYMEHVKNQLSMMPMGFGYFCRDPQRKRLASAVVKLPKQIKLSEIFSSIYDRSLAIEPKKGNSWPALPWKK